MQYEHESLAGADAIAAAGGGAMAGTATMAMTGGTTTTAGAPKPIVKSDRENIGRNDPCWCGSGKKFKKCHGA
jgi:preprotein translocase subunit SecA